MNETPEGCKLVAVLDGAGEAAAWTLCVEDMQGKVVAYLAWPEAWPKTMTPKQLMDCGFQCQLA